MMPIEMELLLKTKTSLTDLFEKIKSGTIDQGTIIESIINIIDVRILDDSDDENHENGIMNSNLDLYPSENEYDVVKDILDDLLNDKITSPKDLNGTVRILIKIIQICINFQNSKYK
jgi:hypothetical protein